MTTWDEILNNQEEAADCIQTAVRDGGLTFDTEKQVWRGGSLSSRFS